MMGGNMQKKKMVDERGDSILMSLQYNSDPTKNPATISQQDSGTADTILGNPFRTAKLMKNY